MSRTSDYDDHNKFLTDEAEREYPPEPEVLAAFRTLFMDPTVPVSEVARQAAAPLLRQITLEPIYIPDCGEIWRTHMRAVRRLGKFNDRLVELIVELSKLPDKNGVFHQLPDFGSYWLEFGFDFADPLPTDPDKTTIRQEWVNECAWGAKLAAVLPVPSLADFLAEEGGMIIRQTLENADWEIYHHPDIEKYDDGADDEWYEEFRDLEILKMDVRTLNGKIPGAYQWIKYLGKELYQRNGRPMRREWDHSIWKGLHGWSKLRWAFWIQRLRWVTTVTALDRRTKLVAVQMAREMVAIAEQFGDRLDVDGPENRNGYQSGSGRLNGNDQSGGNCAVPK
ncbi:DUF3632 domain-containing protein [Aspergillus homomorphus CBS 101889]|uniref:Uncharacterized protein n=1 Tax=Aspergillus homomorphus (strain CBS 101889) TaxID=1450537 RepID=A0A395I8D3_ASPHC|nr:hypothetical protein BO97DRAFT_440030 [Aspergillus homomorphus CBS 101889]RAL16215.1 hypothetical protein BO97DRAFT_440030 [Aspergillus homomorphus CBS 101889]